MAPRFIGREDICRVLTQGTEFVRARTCGRIDDSHIVGEIHDLLRGDSWLRFFHATDDFFGRHLRPGPRSK